MTSKERVLTAFHRQIPDRVPINYFANPGIDHRLKAHFGLRPDDREGLLQALKVDFRPVTPAYCGPRLHSDIPERGVKVDEWGVHCRWIAHASGGYWDYCDFPLAEADEEAAAQWPMPSPDDYDYQTVPMKCKSHEGHALFIGNPGFADVINKAGMLRGTEQALIDLITEDPAGALLTRRRTDIQLEVLRRTLEIAAGAIDFLWMGEDLGTQIAPLISLDLYRSQIRPIHQKYNDLAKAYEIPVMIHSCGSSSWAYDDFIEMGAAVVDTLQPEARNMAPAYLKQRYGDRLAFHGCISTAGPIVTGSVQDACDICRQTLDIMMPGGGYCFAPTHEIQDNSPTENVVVMYQTAAAHGRY